MGEMPAGDHPGTGPEGHASGWALRWRRWQGWQRAHELRNTLVVFAVALSALWVVAVVWDAYVVAALYTTTLLTSVVRLLARRAGAPEWSAGEAYVTRWRRWRRAQRSGA